MIHRVAILVVGSSVLIYWTCVMGMALAVRRRTGSAANFVPRERLGRHLRLIWIPVVAIWIAAPWLAAFSTHRVCTPLWSAPLLVVTASILCIAALAGSVVCWRTMGRQWRMGIDPTSRTKLVTGGPFSKMRHPIYALSILMMACSAIVAASPIMLVIAPLHIGLLWWEARREEGYLHEVHGERYGDYCRRTGRFLPRWRRGVEAPERSDACSTSA